MSYLSQAAPWLVARRVESSRVAFWNPIGRARGGKVPVAGDYSQMRACRYPRLFPESKTYVLLLVAAG